MRHPTPRAIGFLPRMLKAVYHMSPDALPNSQPNCFSCLTRATRWGGLKFAIEAAFPIRFESHLSHTIVCQKFLAHLRKATQDDWMKAIPKTRPRNVTPFVLEGCWTLDALDQPTMRLLRRIADRERVKVADVIHGALELFVAKCEAEADLEKKIIKFPMLKTNSTMDH